MSKQVKEILAQTALLRSNNVTLSNWKLKSFPDEACQFSWLVRMDLSYNQLSALPAAFCSLTCLRWLNLSSNVFTKVPIEVCALTSLKYLQLSQNKVGDSIPSEMMKLLSLEELDLSVNKIKFIGPSCLPKELTHLNISANEVTTLETTSDLFKCVHLEELLIANNKVTAVSAQIEQLSALTLLDLSNNQLKNVPEQFGHLANLTDLNLSNNPKLLDLPPELGDVDLKVMNLTGCKDLKSPPAEVVKSGTPAVLSFLQKLRQEKGKASRFAAKGSAIIRTLRYYPATADISDMLDLSPLEAEGVRLPESPVKRFISTDSSFSAASPSSSPYSSSPLAALPPRHHETHSSSAHSSPHLLHHHPHHLPNYHPAVKMLQKQGSVDHSISSSPVNRTDSPLRKISPGETSPNPPGGAVPLQNPKIAAVLNQQNPLRRPASLGNDRDPSLPSTSLPPSTSPQPIFGNSNGIAAYMSASPQASTSPFDDDVINPHSSSSLPPPPPSLTHHAVAAMLPELNQNLRNGLPARNRTDSAAVVSTSGNHIANVPPMHKIKAAQPKRSSVTELFGDPETRKPPLPPPQATKPKQFPSQLSAPNLYSSSSLSSSSTLPPVLVPASAFDIEQPSASRSSPRNNGLFPSRYCNSYYTESIYSLPHHTFLGTVSATNAPVVVSIVSEKDKESGEYRALIRTPERDFIAKIPEDVVKMPLLANRPSPAALLRALKESNPTVPVSGRFLKVGNPEIKDTMLLLEKRLQVAGMKVGVLYCKEGQTTEEEMYHNVNTSSAFQEFLELIGESIELVGWKGYAGGLQVTPVAPSTKGLGGGRSVYTKWRHADMRESLEVMFHVGPLMRYVESDRQQLERKRHIGNDISVIVFIDTPNGGTAFAPANIRSEYNQVYIVIQAMFVDGKRKYRLGVASKHGVPPFGPPLPDPPLFDPNEEFREFLMLKLFNAERASYTGPAFFNKICKTRQIFIKGLIDDYLDSKE